MAKSHHSERPSEGTKQLLMEAAVALFADRGFDGTTVKDITDRAGVNASLVSYHFGGKDGLYKACLENFGRGRLEAARRFLQPPKNLDELKVRLSLFLEELISCHIEQPEIGRIIHRECDLEFTIAQDIFRDLFLESFKTIISFFRAAQNEKILNPARDPMLMGGFLFGTALHICRSDPIAKKHFNVSVRDESHRRYIVSQLIEQFLFGNANSISQRS